YKGNFYSLPGGTYNGRGCKVLPEYKDGCIILFNSQQVELCRHMMNTGRGEKIINNDHLPLTLSRHEDLKLIS
ncbi:MAG TPA: hypothetical protein VK625_01600, partial [Flavitalea sp.]|nr:hypothetical protein [Flavitalea sp.]